MVMIGYHLRKEKEYGFVKSLVFEKHFFEVEIIKFPIVPFVFFLVSFVVKRQRILRRTQRAQRIAMMLN